MKNGLLEKHELPSLRAILDYEVRASWWAALIGYKPLQKLAAKYFARKAKRKYAAWVKNCEVAAKYP